MERIFMKGSEAIAEAAVRAGCRFFAGYPITPQNEIPEYLSRRLPEVNGEFIQGESEIAAAYMVYGASASGTRSLTSSSSCGIALKSEAISYMAFARLPSVIINCMRGGPGVGSIKGAQQDYKQATQASGNGGFRMLVYAPATVQEAVDTMAIAFDKAEEYHNPVMVLVDGFISVMMEPVVLPEAMPAEQVKALKEATRAWKPYPNPEKRLPRYGYHWYLSTADQNKLAAQMYESWNGKEIWYDEYHTEDAEVLIASYGTSARIARSVIDMLRAEGYKIGLVRPIIISPFPDEMFEKLNYDRVKGILVAEMSIPAQFVDDVDRCVRKRLPIETVLNTGGEMLSREAVLSAAKKLYKEVVQ